MFDSFDSNQTYIWGDVSLDDIFKFSVCMKHSEIPSAIHPNITSQTRVSYCGQEKEKIVNEIVVDGVPEDQVFLYCLLNCDTKCLEVKITNADSTKFEFSEDFIYNVLEMMHEKQLYYTMLYYILVQIYCEDDWISDNLFKIYQCQFDDSGILYLEGHVIPEVSMYVYADYPIIDILKNLKSGCQVPFEVLKNSSIYIELWRRVPNVKSSRKV